MIRLWLEVFRLVQSVQKKHSKKTKILRVEVIIEGDNNPKTHPPYHVVDSILPSTNYLFDQFLLEFLQHSNFKVDICDVFCHILGSLFLSRSVSLICRTISCLRQRCWNLPFTTVGPAASIAVSRN